MIHGTEPSAGHQFKSTENKLSGTPSGGVHCVDRADHRARMSIIYSVASR